MLEALDTIDWAALEHAYGSAADLPAKIRLLRSENPDDRAWSLEMLEMGPFHQGSLYSSTPYVARFVMELALAPDTPDRAKLLLYLGELRIAAERRLTNQIPLPPHKDESTFDEWLGMTWGEFLKIDKALAQHIKDEIDPHSAQLLKFLNDPEAEVRRAIVRLLVLSEIERSQLRAAINSQLAIEPDTDTRAVMAFCAGFSDDGAEAAGIQMLLKNPAESSLVRLAAAFGLAAALKTNLPSDVLTSLADLIYSRPAELRQVDDLHRQFLDGIGARDLLKVLTRLLPEQRSLLVRPLIQVYAALPMSGGTRIGWLAYQQILVLLAFPSGKLPPATTFNDLNAAQQAVLSAFETYDLAYYTARNEWNNFSPMEFRVMLGLELKSEAEFRAFMAGERLARPEDM